MPVIIGGGVGLVGGLIKTLSGNKQKKQGRKLLKNTQMPEYQIPDEITKAAAEGLPQQQYDNAMKNIQRQQLMAIKSSHDRRGGVGAIGGIQQGTADATLNLDAADAAAVQRNKMTLAGYKDKAWDWNKKQKYERDYDYAMNLIGAGNQNFTTGLDQMAGGIGTAAAGFFGDGGGFVGGGGRTRGGRRARAGNTTYYNGYDQNSGYGDFQSEYNQ